MPEWVEALDGRYDQLAVALKPVAAGSQTYITEYFDPLQGADGATCGSAVEVGLGLFAISRVEAQWMVDSFLHPLNALIAAALVHPSLRQDLYPGGAGAGRSDCRSARHATAPDA
jgi:hypothetical protein